MYIMIRSNGILLKMELQEFELAFVVVFYELKTDGIRKGKY